MRLQRLPSYLILYGRDCRSELGTILDDIKEASTNVLLAECLSETWNFLLLLFIIMVKYNVLVAVAVAVAIAIALKKREKKKICLRVEVNRMI